MIAGFSETVHFQYFTQPGFYGFIVCSRQCFCSRFPEKGLIGLGKFAKIEPSLYIVIDVSPAIKPAEAAFFILCFIGCLREQPIAEVAPGETLNNALKDGIITCVSR